MTGPSPNHPNTNRTHCPHGHEYTPENVKLLPFTRRDGSVGARLQCKTCKHWSDKSRDPRARKAASNNQGNQT